MSMAQKLKMYANLLAVPVALIVIWQTLSRAGLLLELILPSPVKVISALTRIVKDGSLATDFSTSLLRVAKGYIWGAVIGLVLGLACGFSKFMERLISPLVDVVRQIPTIAWIPLIIVWFGIGETSKTVIIAKSVAIPLFLNSFQGIRNVPVEYAELADVLEIGWFKRILKIMLPSAMPAIFTGLRLAAGYAWMAVVTAEMLGGLTGLGYGLLRARDFLESDILIGLMVVIGIVGLVLDRAIRLVERQLLHWQKNYQG